MPETVSAFLSRLAELAWGLPLIVLLIGGGLYLLCLSRFRPLSGFGHAFLLMAGRFQHPGEENAEGQITHFQALNNALASTIGMGNIAGVAVAINWGGPGAVFWMWVAALIGMNTKFFECTLSTMYRGRDHRGEVQGGPMYLIDTALGKKWKPLSFFFAACGLLGTLTLFQINQLAAYTLDRYDFKPVWVGVFCACLTAYVLKGGLNRLARFTSAMVPFMCLLYVLTSLTILFLHAERIPEIFLAIFREAFQGRAALGGATAVAFMEILKIGVRRASFSNESGIGTSPMAHSNVKTSEPISQGLVAMLEPFLDTIIVCTMTALVILVSIDTQGLTETSGIVLSTKAFEESLPGFGAHFLGVSIFFFSFSTMIGYANYNEKCWHYLFRGRWGLSRNVFIFFYCATLIIGALATLDDVVNLLDTAFAFMAIPNMLATLWLAPRVVQQLGKYYEKYKIGKRG